MLGSTVVDTIWISRESLPTTLKHPKQKASPEMYTQIKSSFLKRSTDFSDYGTCDCTSLKPSISSNGSWPKSNFPSLRSCKNSWFRGKNMGIPPKSGKIGMTEMKPYTKKGYLEPPVPPKVWVVKLWKKKHVAKKRMLQGWVDTRIGGTISNKSLQHYKSIPGSWA